jgi:SAM-dependent methyltransferase
MEFGKLIPQVFFDVLARYVPGAVLLGSWIILLGQHAWAHLLNVLLAGHLDGSNALPAATLVLFFMPFVVGYVLAPFAKFVQRGNEHHWWLLPRKWGIKEDKAAGNAYDWLRVNNKDAGALCAKIRAEFTMHNALSVAFLPITVMAGLAGDYYWAIASGLAVPLMAVRGATTEKTFHSTTRKFCKAAEGCVLEEPASQDSSLSRLIADLADVKREDRVLDVGCRLGAGVDEAARRDAAEVTGVDHSLLMVLLGRYLSYPRSGRDIEFKWWWKAKRGFRWWKAETLPVDGRTFTVAWAIRPARRWDTVDVGLTELCRVLEPRGRLIIAGRLDRPGAWHRAARRFTKEQACETAKAARKAGFTDVEDATYRVGRRRLAVVSAQAPSASQDENARRDPR